MLWLYIMIDRGQDRAYQCILRALEISGCMRWVSIKISWYWDNRSVYRLKLCNFLHNQLNIYLLRVYWNINQCICMWELNKSCHSLANRSLSHRVVSRINFPDYSLYKKNDTIVHYLNMKAESLDWNLLHFGDDAIIWQKSIPLAFWWFQKNKNRNVF